MLLAGTFVLWAFEAAVYLAVARAHRRSTFSATGALYLVALTNLFAMIPAAPGLRRHLRRRRRSSASRRSGRAARRRVSYLLLLRFILFIPITIVGLVILVARYGGWSRCADVSSRRRRVAPHGTPRRAATDTPSSPP